MYKLTIERLDPKNEIQYTTVYLTKSEATLLQAAGIKCEERDVDRFNSSDITKRPWAANIPTIDLRRQIETKVYEQVIENLDISKIIKAANGIE